jgi:hypothetical protein
MELCIDRNGLIVKSEQILQNLRAHRALRDCNSARQARFSLECPLPITRNAAVILFFLLLPALVWAQTANPDKQASPAQEQENPQSASTEGASSQSGTDPQAKPQAPVPSQAPAPAPADQKKPDSSEGKQTSRMFWVVPNFAAVSANTQLPPLSSREKFKLGTEDSVDYSSFVWAGFVSGQSMALRSYPEFGTGAAGYGRYYWRAFADQASGAFFTEAIFPVLTHEDPRYFTLGHGGFFRRTAYALTRVVVTRTDSGGRSFNYSEVVGNAFEAGLSNAYYPAEERSLSKTTVNWATQLEAAALNNFFREFWPDIRQHIFRQK